MIVESITKEDLAELCGRARLQRKEERERLLNTDAKTILQRDLSAPFAGLSQSRMRREFEPKGPLLPALPIDEKVGAYEDEMGVRLILFARAAAAPILANFGYKPSKRFEQTLRHSAKVRACQLHFYRLIDGYVAIEVESESDASFLRRLSIKAM